MLKIDSIENGIVIDHIKEGMGMRVYNQLELDKLECRVAIIMNAKSNKKGKKDIIKIENEMNINLDALGFLVPDATVNVIKNGEITSKHQLALPQTIVNVVKCKNPRCITTIEQDIDQIFNLVDKETATYRCAYCEKKHKN